MTAKKTFVMLGLPWYRGPDEATSKEYLAFTSYMGGLSERTILRDKLGVEAFDALDLPALTNDPLAEPTVEDYEGLGILQFGICDYSRTSLVGLARERIAENCVAYGADYLISWDADMRFPMSSFLRLWRHQKPIVAALAFTARDPIYPAVFGVRMVPDPSGDKMYERSDPLFDYPEGTLIGDEHTDGWLATGAAVMLVDVGVFRELDQPWFQSTGSGEDWFFCARAAEAGIGRFVDSSLVVDHKCHDVIWCNAEMYWKTRRERPQDYKSNFGELKPVAAGRP